VRTVCVVCGAMAGHHHLDHHGHVHHIDEADWAALAEQTELQGEVTLSFLTDTIAWLNDVRDPDAPPVRRVLDIGSGPGVGTCELARLFPLAQVVAVDSSPAMLERATRRIDSHGLSARVTTLTAELPHGLDNIEPVDVVWASMSLHHVGDEVAALRVLGGLLAPFGQIAIAELGDPTRTLPAELGIGRAGLADRLDGASAEWFGGMRAGLPDSVGTRDLSTMVAEAGLRVVGSRLATQRLDAPLPPSARRVVRNQLDRAREQLADHLDAADIETLRVLADEHHPLGVMCRDDVFMEDSRQIVIAGQPFGRIRA